MHMRKKAFVLTVTYLAAAIFYLGVFCILQSITGAAYRRTAEYGYSRAFSEVVSSVDKLDKALQRGQYASGSEVSADVCADIAGSCQAVEMTMAVLPFSTQEMEQTAAFINMAGDYAGYLLKTCGENGFSHTERENMARLAVVSGKLKSSLEKLRDGVDSGKVLMDEPENILGSRDGDFMSAAMLKYENGLKDVPVIDYNGSFVKSETEETENPVSEKEAKKAAEEFFGIKIKGTEFKSEAGAYCFSFEGGTVSVDARGNVISMLSQRSVAGDMESSELEGVAEKFLEDRGFEEMKLTDSKRHNSVLTAEFSCGKGGILCENDCIKVSVAADDGSIYAFDAAEYYSHHKDRSLAAPKVSEEAAKAAVTENLTAKQAQLVLCRDSSLERLCYAFDCVNVDGDSVRVFVDANTGKQFKIEI